MPRVLTSDRNTLRIHDNISNSTIEIYYRTPTPEEYAKYANNMLKRTRNKLINRTGENRQENGIKILTGFREGDFVMPVERDGKTVNRAISSDPESKNYEPNWKKLIAKHAADIVDSLASHVFEQTTTPEDPDDVEVEEGYADPD